MTILDRAAIKRAATDTVQALARAQDAVRHLFALIDGATDAQQIAAAVGKTVAQIHGAGGGRAPEHFFAYQGRSLTAAELAAIAGCERTTMRMRLKRYTPEQAVAMGNADKQRRAKDSRVFSTETGDHPMTKFYEIGGERLIARELAERAGCSLLTMRQRLKHHDAATALAMGAADKNRRRALKMPPATAAPTQKPAPAKRMDLTVVRKPEAVKLDSSRAAIVPDNVKRTVAVTPPDRFHVDPAFVVPTFTAMRTGEYLSSGSAVERAYGGAR